MTRPLAIDLYCGLGGWTDGLLAEGWRVIGFDIERHEYGEHRYPAQLVVQDVLTLHGSQFKNADLIVASPPCQEYSYMAMPWTRAKQIARALRGEGEFPEGYAGSRTIGELNALFDACFRIQTEACEAAGRHIPLIVENVRGAIPWIGRSRWAFGSFHLWGDVPALMPMTMRARKYNPDRIDHSTKNTGGSWFNIGSPGQKETGRNPVHELTGRKSQGMNWSDRSKRGQDFTRVAGAHCGVKQGGDWFNASQPSISRLTGSKSPARKAASAMIAKIPLPLSQHIAATYHPDMMRAAS